MAILLIDVGNTTSDFRVFDEENRQLKKLIRPLTHDGVMSDATFIQTALAPFDISFSAIIYVSVVPKANVVIEALASLYNIPIYSARNHFRVKPEHFKLDNLSELGADFIANFYGYICGYKKRNAAIVSLGTATTIFIIRDLEFVGTSISPGLKFSLDALLSNAALLKSMDYRATDQVMATNTYEAINIGTINGHFYMLMGLIDAIKAKHPIDEIIFTGGNSIYYTDLCAQRGITIDDALIFKGLIHMYRENQTGIPCRS